MIFMDLLDPHGDGGTSRFHVLSAGSTSQGWSPIDYSKDGRMGLYSSILVNWKLLILGGGALGGWPTNSKMRTVDIEACNEVV